MPEPFVVITDLTKAFAGTVALRAFSLELNRGDVHVLLGHNGSGKSTLIKILAGYHSPDGDGSVTIDGHGLTFGLARSSYELGCRFVHQNLGLISSMSVADNLAFGSGFPTTAGTIRAKAARQFATDSLQRAGLTIDPSRKIEDLSPAEQTGVAIARALSDDPEHPAKLLVLDEPTASLPPDEVDHLLRTLQASASSGIPVLLVTHHLEEVFRIGTAVTVLRDGITVLTAPIRDVSRSALVDTLVGDEFAVVERRSGAASARQPVLDVRRISSAAISDASFTARPGEIVGVAGLTGSGRESLLGAVFGASHRYGGTVRVGGHEIPTARPDLSVASGAAYLPPERAIGSFAALSARENLSVSKLSPFWSRLRLDRKQERADTATWFERLGVQPRFPERAFGTFSGGNQQKILFGKIARPAPDVLLMDEPTQGVDIGAKAELHAFLFKLAESGAAVVFSSTDVDELELLSDRVLVMREGRISNQLTGDAITHAGLMRAFLGDGSKHEAAL